MIQRRREQPTLWHRGLAKDIEDLWEPLDERGGRDVKDASAC
jgi:hypothetical protein